MLDFIKSIFNKKNSASKLSKLILAIIILFTQTSIFAAVLYIGKKPASATDLNVNPDFWNRADLDFGTKSGGVLGGDQFSAVSRNSIYSTSITNTNDTTKFAVSKSNSSAFYGGYGYSGYWGLVGAGGKVIRTSDKTTWSIGTSNTVNNLYGATFHLSPSTQFAVGASGTVIKSADWGSNWATKVSGVADDLYGVKFSSSTVGVAAGAGGRIIKSTDDGESWGSKDSGVAVDLRGVTNSGASTYIAVGDSGTVVRSTDTGDTWATVGAGVTANDLRAVAFLSTGTGFAVGDSGTILRSTDFGANWSALTSGTTEDLYSVFLPESNKLRAVGTNSTHLYSSDNGVNWTIDQKPGVNGTLRIITGTDINDFIVSGDNGSMRRYSLGYTDDRRWSNVVMADTNYSLALPLAGFLKVKLEGFQANEYATIRFMHYSPLTDQESEPSVMNDPAGLDIKLTSSSLSYGDYGSQYMTSATSIAHNSQDYMFSEIHFAAQRHSNQREAMILVDSKELMAFTPILTNNSSYVDTIEIIINSDAGTLHLDQLSLAGPTTPSSKATLADSFPDDNNLSSLANVEHYQATSNPWTKNPINPVFPQGGFSSNGYSEVIRNGNTLDAWVTRISGSNRYVYHASSPYPLTQDFTIDATEAIAQKTFANRLYSGFRVFLDDDGYYKMAFMDYRCYIDGTWKSDDYGGVALAIGGTEPDDTFDIYPSEENPLWLMTRRGYDNPMGESPDSMFINKITGLNPDEKYFLTAQGKYSSGGTVWRDLVLSTGNSSYNFKTWPTGNVPLPVVLYQVEIANIIQRGPDDYILLAANTGYIGNTLIGHSRSPYYWPTVLSYPLASAGQWDDKAAFVDIEANEDDGIFDMFYAGSDGVNGNTGHATMRIDAFDWMSLSSGQNSGNMTTVEIEKPSTGWNQLKLNVDQVSANDTMKVEILDATSGNPISGFTSADADAITSAGTQVAASWAGNTSLKSITSNIKLKFYFTKTTSAPRLYAYKLTENNLPQVTDLKVNSRTDPAGIDLTPALSWTFTDTDPTETQKAYQVQVASSKANIDAGTADIWDTGKTNSSASSLAWGGGSLSYETVYWWKMRVWDQNDNPSSYSDAATFATSAAQTSGGPSTITEIKTEYKYISSTLVKYLSSLLPIKEESREQVLIEKIEELKKEAAEKPEIKESIKYINKPFGLPISFAYPLMMLSLALNLVWILRVAITRTAPYLP